LILIVDYILDWARDIYRPSILKLLKSIATGSAFDQTSLTVDDDIFSMRRKISDWIPAPPSTIVGVDTEDLERPPVALEHQSMLPSAIRDTKFGSVRSAVLNDHRFVCLFVTESNVTSLLYLAGELSQNPDDAKKAARELFDEIRRWDEVLFLTAADLNELEVLWTGKKASQTTASRSSFGERFYAILEFSCFISSSWDIVREITCLAISTTAFEILNSDISFYRPPYMERVSYIRSCPLNVLRECVECLRSGSPWQVLLSAVSSTSRSLYPLPESRRIKFAGVEALALGHVRFPRVKPFIEKYLDLDQRHGSEKHFELPIEVQEEEFGKVFPGKTMFEAVRSNAAEYWRVLISAVQKGSGFNFKGIDRSFHRQSEKRRRLDKRNSHDSGMCGRCRRSGRNAFSTSNFAPYSHSLSWCGSVLVESLESRETSLASDGDKRHGICLFVVDNLGWKAQDGVNLALLVEALLKTGMLYHTIRHRLSKDVCPTRAICWNLPLPYRPHTELQYGDVQNWIRELRGQSEIPNRLGGVRMKMTAWDHMQMLLYFLRSGYPYVAAESAVAQSGKSSYNELLEHIDAEGRQKHERAGKSVFPQFIDPLPTYTIRGDVDEAESDWQ
jgi:hypothetical protein